MISEMVQDRESKLLELKSKVPKFDALIKYDSTSPSLIAQVYDNRIEILSPGDFPGLIDINNLGDGTIYLRNPALVRLAYQLHLIETRGTGIRLIYESCRKAGIKRPVYHDEGDFVKVVFYLEPDVQIYKNEDEAILAFLKSQESVTAQQVADYLSVSRNTALRKLISLIDKRKIIKKGKGPAVRYVLK